MKVEYHSCQNCGKFVELNGNDDFHFEVYNREDINVPNPNAVTVCGYCWDNDGYKEEYIRQLQ